MLLSGVLIEHLLFQVHMAFGQSPLPAIRHQDHHHNHCYESDCNNQNHESYGFIIVFSPVVVIVVTLPYLYLLSTEFTLCLVEDYPKRGNLALCHCPEEPNQGSLLCEGYRVCPSALLQRLSKRDSDIS